MDNRTKSNYNKIEYCLGNSLELLSAPTVFVVCQDSSVFRAVIAFVYHSSTLKVNRVIVFPRMVGNVRATHIVFKISLMFLSLGFKASASFSYITPTNVVAGRLRPLT